MPFSMKPIQEQRQTIKPILTPKQQYSLQILTVPEAKLADMIQEALRENPFIEIEAWNNYLQRHSPTDYVARQARASDSLPDLQGTLSKKPSLIEHLMRQLCELRLTHADLLLGEHIIGNLDGHGYLAVPIDELATASGMPLPNVEAVLKRIQNFDPVGVAARSLRECLLVQLEHAGEGESLAARIVSGCLEDLATRRYSMIARELKVDVRDVERAHKRIASLEPKPAREFDCEQIRVAIPEVMVERAQGEWRVQLADSNLPRFRVNKSRYLLQVEQLSGEQKELKKVFENQLNDAQQLFGAVRDRHQTLLKVATAMFKRQEAFLAYGQSWLKPMMMKEIGAEIGICESTVSRAVSDKFARTPHGIFPLRFFFQDSVARKTGAPVSSEYVKSKIRALVDAEDRREPLTDDEIVRRLGDAYAIKMARRTVNKYRDLLNILPAHQRRRESASVAESR